MRVYIPVRVGDRVTTPDNQLGTVTEVRGLGGVYDVVIIQLDGPETYTAGWRAGQLVNHGQQAAAAGAR